MILLYDAFWLFAIRNMTTFHLVKVWTALNSFTLLLAIATYAIARSSTGDVLLAEQLAFVWIAIATIVDVAEIISSHEIIKDTVLSFLSKEPDTLDGTESSQE